MYLPRRIEEDAELRLDLTTTFFTVSTRLKGQVFDRRRPGVRQLIPEGDATGEIGSDRLRVVAETEAVPKTVGDVELRPPVFTPDGDGVNDRLMVAYSLFGVMEADVEIVFYNLGGGPVRRLVLPGQRAGRNEAVWDGRDEAGRRVPPGLYLCQVTATTGRGAFEVVKNRSRGVLIDLGKRDQRAIEGWASGEDQILVERVFSRIRRVSSLNNPSFLSNKVNTNEFGKIAF